MATVRFTTVYTTDWKKNTATISWPAMAANDVGQALELPSYADKSIQISGTPGGATVVLEGSDNGSTYVTLSDPQGNALSFMDVALKFVVENVRYIRPHVTGGDGTTAITATLTANKSAKED